MLNVLTEKQIEEAVKPVGSPTEVARMTAWLEDRIAKSKKSPIAEVVMLTPVLASLLLDRNPVNRPISKTGKAELRQDIATGRYVFNGESIIVSDTGVLNDGQHRCLNVVVAAIHQRHTAKVIKLADDPLNDAEAAEKQVATLMSAWNKAGSVAREEFLCRIDRPIMDKRFA